MARNACYVNSIKQQNMSISKIIHTENRLAQPTSAALVFCLLAHCITLPAATYTESYFEYQLHDSGWVSFKPPTRKLDSHCTFNVYMLS